MQSGEGELRSGTTCPIAWIVALSTVACGIEPELPGTIVGDEGIAVQQRCLDHEPLRRAFFGDLHVHTALSSDAWAFGVRVTPDDAYRYAFGQTILLPHESPLRSAFPLRSSDALASGYS